MANYVVGPYMFTRFIALGTSGAVWECCHQPTGERLACKIIDIHNIANDDFWAHFRNELIIHSQIRHSGITRLVDVVLDQTHIYVFIELCDGGDLEQVVMSSGGLPEDRARHYFRRIMDAVSYIHRLGVAHRDIKLENILVTSADEAKLTDFGLCKQETSESPMMLTTCGTIIYAAPEIIQRQPYDGKKADIWSAGVMLYAMVGNHFPWVTDPSLSVEGQFIETTRQITQGEIPPLPCSLELEELLGAMLTLEPDERPTADEILQHPWVMEGADPGTGQELSPDPRVVQVVTQVITELEQRRATL